MDFIEEEGEFDGEAFIGVGLADEALDVLSEVDGDKALGDDESFDSQALDDDSSLGVVGKVNGEGLEVNEALNAKALDIAVMEATDEVREALGDLLGVEGLVEARFSWDPPPIIPLRIWHLNSIL